jgi:hypothetical protein
MTFRFYFGRGFHAAFAVHRWGCRPPQGFDADQTRHLGLVTYAWALP